MFGYRREVDLRRSENIGKFITLSIRIFKELINLIKVILSSTLSILIRDFF